MSALVLLLAVLLGGTLGYMYIEGWGWLDAFWMVVITLTSIGYGEVHELSHDGRIFTLFLIFGGLGVVTYTVTQVTRLVVEQDLVDLMRQRRRRSMTSKLTGNYIVVGYGRLGRSSPESCSTPATASASSSETKRPSRAPSSTGTPW